MRKRWKEMFVYPRLVKGDVCIFQTRGRVRFQCFSSLPAACVWTLECHVRTPHHGSKRLEVVGSLNWAACRLVTQDSCRVTGEQTAEFLVTRMAADHDLRHLTVIKKKKNYGGGGGGSISSRATIWGECSTIYSPPSLFLLFFFFFKVEISLLTLIPLFTPGLVHSCLASWDDCGRVFPDELRVISFPDSFPTLCLDSGIVSPLRLGSGCKRVLV